jgi:hypothetical protein
MAILQNFYCDGITKNKTAIHKKVKDVSKNVDVLRRTAYRTYAFFLTQVLSGSMEQAIWLAEVKNSLRDWDSSKDSALCAAKLTK